MDEPRKINVTIAGRSYALKASSPENEEIIRKAAKVTTQKIAGYQKLFPTKSELDILTFVALNECITNLNKDNQIGQMQDQTKAFAADLAAYVENIEKSR
ncbi:MAG: cell division protein ZapA [Bacteroidales bacterium]|nr:cell division protein ZapA [Bacteroidales bacterium]